MSRQTLFNLAVIFSLLMASFSIAAPAAAAPPQNHSDDDPPRQRGPEDEYIRAIQRTANMVSDGEAVRLVNHYGLDLINVAWEDTGRYYNSSVGPNISDVTIQVQYEDPASNGYQLALMPVIRFPNFTDKTADIPMDEFYLLVGNEDGQPLERVSLREYLGNFRQYLHDPQSWDGRRSSLLAPRDSHVLVSAQAAFLPIPEQGEATFNPVIFNYQSHQGDPAILTIVATREGTSATIIDNVRDAFPAGFSWGQRLFFNQNGERASLTGQRASEFGGGIGPGGRSDGSGATQQQGLNMVMIIQVPLKQKNPMTFGLMEEAEGDAYSPSSEAQRSDVENAVIGHGEVEGPFTEIDDLAIERDPDFPVRVTVQFYKATSNGIVSEADVAAIADQIEKVYDQAEYVGSLVVDGPSDRPTEYDGPKLEPADWWDQFWNRFEDNVGMSRDGARKLWQKLGIVAWRWGEKVR
ncbi:MAG: hypothetical protein ACLFWD_06250 [Anaerolineales bacterium]